jgi:glycosyltransferase involved in cell wall biosynthesis
MTAPSICSNVQPGKPIRILHVLGSLNRGGGEVWLMNVLRNIDRSKFQFDFLVHTREEAVFDAEAQQLGSRILRLDPPRQSPLLYGRNLTRLLLSAGPFDVIHSHVHFFSGYTLRIAKRCSVPSRISHSHTTDNTIDSLPLHRRTFRKLYRQLTRNWLWRYATAGLACSPAAAGALYGSNWNRDHRWTVLPYGFDFSRFANLPSKEHLRATLGILPGKLLLGQVGRLVEVKNHSLSIDILSSLVARGINAHLLLVGGGPLEGTIRDKLNQLGLTERVTLAGDQADVLPFLGAMDCMLFPSFYEGFGIVVLEAQAAGVPVIASDRVPAEVSIVTNMVRRLPLEAGAHGWADEIIQQQAQANWRPSETSKIVSDSPYGIQQCVERLSNVYRSHRDSAEIDGCQSPHAVTASARH